MSDRFAKHRPPAIRNLLTRTRITIGAAAVFPALLVGMPASTHPDAPRDGGLVACAYPLTTQDVPATVYPKIRAEFASSRWPDLRTAGTAYTDLAIQLYKARGGTDGYQAVWLYQGLSAACARHGRPLSATSSQSAPRTASALHQGAGPRPRLMTPRAAITIGGIAAPWGPTIDPLPERRPLRRTPTTPP